jgi:N-acetylmuramoyl-L-alanine amidase
MRILPSPNHDARPQDGRIDLLLLHYTGMRTADEALRRLRDPETKVSAHYCIDEDGTLVCLVPEERRAWHAGVAHWAGESDINGRSIGIELVNPGHEFGYRDFPEPQMTVLIELARDILARHPIAPARVLGHSDVAPLRKCDPGELFDWSRLAEAGIGLWPARPVTAEAPARELLARFGYGFVEEDEAAVLRAFQRHFRPAAITGEADAETLGLLAALVQAKEQAAQA